jgi:hypothetical protein
MWIILSTIKGLDFGLCLLHVMCQEFLQCLIVNCPVSTEWKVNISSLYLLIRAFRIY